MTEETPAVAGSMDTLFLVETRVELPIRRPEEGELRALRQEGLPFPRRSFVALGDLELEVGFTLRNTSDEAAIVAVVIDGFNEFHEYVPGIAIEDDEAIADYAQWERTFELEPLTTIQGIVREEEMDEVAIDLATVVNGAPSSNRIVHPQTQSALDAESMMYRPAHVPGLMGFRLGLRAPAPSRVLLEATVRIQDPAEALVQEGRPFRAEPEQFMPVRLEEE